MILVCGEALVDLFVEESADGALTSRVVLGGSPMNVAIGLARLGEEVGYFGGLSGDRFGLSLRRALLAEGVDLTFAKASDRLSTISVVATDACGQPSYSFHGEGKADRDIDLSSLPPALPAAIEALTFGSYTLAVMPVAEAYLALARRESRSRVIALDPNIRVNVTPDIPAWRLWFDAFLAEADIVKARDEDTALAYGEHVAIEDVVAGWFAAGPKVVLVTRGGAGARGYLRTGGTVTLPGHRVAVVDTVGAGDTFHAATLAYLSQAGLLTKAGLAGLTEDQLRQAMAFAISAAAVTCSRPGADLPTMEDVAALSATP